VDAGNIASLWDRWLRMQMMRMTFHIFRFSKVAVIELKGNSMAIEIDRILNPNFFIVLLLSCV
jgi:hypothetical protein